MLRIVAAYIAGLLVAYVAAAVAQTQHVMGNLEQMGVDVSLAVRLEATVHDLVGLATSYLPIIAVAFGIAFPVAALVVRRLPRWRRVGYPLAGAVAMLAVHLILEALLEITPIAAARTTLGLALQVLAGTLGGWVFLKCLPGRSDPA